MLRGGGVAQKSVGQYGYMSRMM